MSFETIMDPNIKTQLPLARVAKISKLVTDELKLPAETSHLITFATEQYIKMLAKEASNWAQMQSRKTILRRDIDKCIQRDWIFMILEDALDDWPQDEQEITTNIEQDGECEVIEEVSAATVEGLNELSVDEERMEVDVEVQSEIEYIGVNDQQQEQNPSSCIDIEDCA